MSKDHELTGFPKGGGSGDGWGRRCAFLIITRPTIKLLMLKRCFICSGRSSSTTCPHPAFITYSVFFFYSFLTCAAGLLHCNARALSLSSPHPLLSFHLQHGYIGSREGRGRRGEGREAARDIRTRQSRIAFSSSVQSQPASSLRSYTIGGAWSGIRIFLGEGGSDSSKEREGGGGKEEEKRYSSLPLALLGGQITHLLPRW